MYAGAVGRRWLRRPGRFGAGGTRLAIGQRAHGQWLAGFFDFHDKFLFTVSLVFSNRQSGVKL
jgi:hypothetical protein